MSFQKDFELTVYFILTNFGDFKNIAKFNTPKKYNAQKLKSRNLILYYINKTIQVLQVPY